LRKCSKIGQKEGAMAEITISEVIFSLVVAYSIGIMTGIGIMYSLLPKRRG
jgi:hypothetical protein